MGQEQSNPQQEPTTRSGGPGSRQDDEERPQVPPEYGTLLHQYGEAMLRIGQLEAKVERLSSQLQSDVPQESYGNIVVPPQETEGLRGHSELP